MPAGDASTCRISNGQCCGATLVSLVSKGVARQASNASVLETKSLQSHKYLLQPPQ
jgi:hypothetical protein